MKAEEWVKSAVGQLPFAKDRKALTRELTAHIEDRKAALMDAGCPAEQAEEKAVAAMGDPKETAEELRDAMVSWMNWVILLLRLTALVLAVMVGLHLYDLIRSSRPTDYTSESTLSRLFAWEEQPGAQHIRNGRCDETASSAGHTVRIPWAGITGDGRVMLLVQVEQSFPEAGPVSFRKLLELRGPDGRDVYTFRSDAGRQGGSCYLSLSTVGFMDPETPWVELSFAYGAEPFSLKIVFEEAGS